MMKALPATAAVLAATMMMPAAAGAQSKSALGDLALEDLFSVRVQPVFGASERLQPVSEAPATVTIVTAADIKRYGYRTVADILRGAGGFHISDDRNYSYVGVRGVGLAGDYNTRVLLLLNGHKVNDNVYDQAFIGPDLGVDLAMLERVEIIRGPASSIYGTSAFFAVINLVTRTGASIDGATFEAGLGTLGDRRARASFGRRFSPELDVALSGSFDFSEGVERLYYPAFDAPETNNGIAENLDGEETGTLYGRVALRNLTVTAAFGRRLRYVPTAAFFTLFNSQEPRQETVDGHLILDAQYDHVAGKTRMAADVSFDRWYYDAVYPYEGESAELPVVTGQDETVGVRWSFGGRVTRPLPGKQTLTAGAELLANVRQKQAYFSNDPSEEGFLVDQSSSQSAVYLQDEIRLQPWLLVNGGIRHDRYEQFARTTPRGAVIVLPTGSQSFKYLYGRAFRAPNAYELYYFSEPTVPLRPEAVTTHELVWEQYVGEWLRTSIAGHRSIASQLIALELLDSNDTLGGYAFFNRGTIKSKGVTLEGEVRSKHGLQALANLVVQRAKDEEGGTLTNSPNEMANVRFSAPGPIRGSMAALEVQYLSSRRTPTGTVVPGATVANLTVSARLTQSVELFGTVRNLLDRSILDPASEEHWMDAIPQNGRTARIGLRWQLSPRRP
jgi:iron complex outermembrane receptor protein